MSPWMGKKELKYQDTGERGWSWECDFAHPRNIVSSLQTFQEKLLWHHHNLPFQKASWTHSHCPLVKSENKQTTSANKNTEGMANTSLDPVPWLRPCHQNTNPRSPPTPPRLPLRLLHTLSKRFPFPPGKDTFTGQSARRTGAPAARPSGLPALPLPSSAAPPGPQHRAGGPEEPGAGLEGVRGRPAAPHPPAATLGISASPSRLLETPATCPAVRRPHPAVRPF